MVEQSKIINIHSVGKVLLRKSKRAKRINISIKPNRGVVVAIPKNISFKAGEKVLYEKMEWVKKHLITIQNVENNKLIFDETTNFTTKEHKLKIQQTETQEISAQVSTASIHVYYPKFLDVKSEKVQSAIRHFIIWTLRQESKKYLPIRVEQLSKEFGFNYNRVFVKNQKSRWGSCSNRNNINLNIHLMRTTDKLIDYVILHELSHTIEKNHGVHFWKLLNNITNNKAKILDKELKKYSLWE